jgi:beta-lactamase superfamily II metal-dependent hydrolase
MPATTSRDIRIRMYRVGFGDCFLLTLPGADKAHHILIDCGVHARGDIKTMGAVVDDILKETGGKLDLIVATHAHQDHLSGFGSEAEKFRRSMHVREVWLPWTEDKSDPDAARLKKKHLALAEGLRRQFAALGGERFNAVREAVANLIGNEPALTLLKSELGAKVEYRQADQEIQDAAGIKGLSAHVLGPPKNQDFLARMDPPDTEKYLRMAGAGAGAATALAPFPPKWEYDYRGKAPLTARELKLLEEEAASTSERLGFALDQAINNTSVVLLLRYGGQAMLFAGDAQYGNWQYWVEKDKAEELLAQVTFYKVAHHGSENATPRSALDRMPTQKFVAMLSTQNTPWPSIPYGKLVDALEHQTGERLVRSDSLPVQGAPAGPAAGKLPKGVVKGKLWYDCFLPVEQIRHARSHK